jgi:SAM-dependent methyltransferase
MNAMVDLDRFGFSSFAGFNAQLVRWRYELLSAHYHGPSCLELGSSDGQGTEYLLDHFDTVTAVDGSAGAVRALRERFAGTNSLTAVHSYFEMLSLERRFSTVIAAHILEHVNDPQAVLSVARRHLADDGVLIADVPNALSLHRQLGVKLGMLEAVTALNDADRSIGHQRVYTPAAFRAEIERAGFQILDFGGVFLKLLSNAQMAEQFDERVLEALVELGSDLPELAAEIFVVARKA